MFGIYNFFPLLVEKILMLHYLKLGLELIIFQIVGLYYDKYKDQSRSSYSSLLWNQISYQDCSDKFTGLKVICILVSMRLLLLHCRACTMTKALPYILCHCYQLFIFFFFFEVCLNQWPKEFIFILFQCCSFENNSRLEGPELLGLASYDTNCS